jgi:uncharacterized BrkB/YihY/UPF0761 family membrane protein
MLEKIAVWGLRLVAAVIFLSGLIALASVATSNSIHIHSTSRGHNTFTFTGFGAIGMALVILGVGSAALYLSAPPRVRRNWWRTSAFGLVLCGAIAMGANVLFGA